MTDFQDSDSTDRHIIRLRGLPWSASTKDILAFLKDVEVLNGEKGIHIVMRARDGRPSGEAFVEVCSSDDIDTAFSYNKNSLGQRYIEIFNSSADEYDENINGPRLSFLDQDTGKDCDMNDDRHIIKLRGLPWTASAKEILDFLKDVAVVNGEKGIHMAISPRDGRPNGEAFLEVASMNDVDTAFSYNKNLLGHRYIEIFNAKPDEYDQCMRRQNVMSQDTFVKLRGLPFSCKLEDIEQFFEGLEIRNGKTGIFIIYSHGRMTGEAYVQFRSSDDAENALKRNREKIGSRYIEIFRSSAEECRRSTVLNQSPRQMSNNNNNGNSFGGNFGGNDRMNDRMNRNGGGGPGLRNQRSNFRERPYPLPNCSDNNPWGSRSSDDGGQRNNFRDNFRDNSNLRSNFRDNMSNDDNFDFGGDRSWKSNNSVGASNSFIQDRGWFGGSNSFSSGNNNFNNDRGFGGGGSSNNNNNSFGNSGFNNRDRDLSFGSNNSMNNSNNSGNNGGSGPPYLVHMRGLPFSCGDMEIYQFFAPLKLVDCQVLYNDNGRHTGEADAYFGSVADAQEAMKKHKEKIGSRYIELFANRNSERRGRF